jgi:hypothetical protein
VFNLIPLNRRIAVDPLVAQLEAAPELWDEHRPRTAQYNSPHANDVSDIWVRYNAWENYTGDLAAFNEEHESVWYPCCEKLPAAQSIISYVYGLADGAELGGVLITKIAPGGEVVPHSDNGWHAEYYDKYAVQIKGNSDQAFHFEEISYSAEPGEVYKFNNQATHWVTNNSNEDRITMIICIRSHGRAF